MVEAVEEVVMEEEEGAEGEENEGRMIPPVVF